MSSSTLVSTGIPGLDHILGGGLTANRLYLTQGDPGTGKTTLALQFLLSGHRAGQRVMYITLSETKAELQAVAESHGWSLDGVELFEISAGEESLKADEQYSVFHPSEIELGEAIQTLLVEIDRVQPRLAVIDSLSEMRLLARDPLRYRRQILALKQFFIQRNCTVMLLDDPATKVGEHQFQTLAHGVIQLEQFVPDFGTKRRRIQIVKLRGQLIDGAYHDFTLGTGGITVFPRIVASDHRVRTRFSYAASGLPELDDLLGGGIAYGTSTLILGASGTGKTTLAVQYAYAALQRGEKAALFHFDERLDTLLARTSSLGMNLEPYIDNQQLIIRQIDPAELAPGEFACSVSEAVRSSGVKFVLIDSLNGYLNAMPQARFLLTQMHELLTFLGQHGVITLLLVAQHGGLTAGIEAPIDISYLADAVIWLRYFEFGGQVRKAISVIKNRVGHQEPNIREMQITSHGIRIGRPLNDFHGILTGTPAYHGASSEILGGGHDLPRR
jgi:circadian clock protein KaiC